MKKILVAFISIAVIFSTFSIALASSYVGNSNSKKFHYSDCPSVEKMNPANKINFNSREEAVNSGYVPCKRCNP